ncbi:MAG: hypothetical protein M3347_00135, partial [Armatimonadota bacterium]|nr:hypothetical protein [Armatimonadota bacterium]
MRDFASPPASYRPLLHWFWQGHLSEAALREQLRAMHQAGGGGVVLRPSPSSSPAAFDPVWMRLLRGCIDEAKTQGLAIWLSDEIGTTRGRARGQAIPPALRAHYMKFRIEDVPLRAARQWRSRPVAGQVLCAVAVPVAGKGYDFAASKDLLPALEQPASLLLSLESDARIFLFWQESADDLDLLNAQAGHWFIGNTHELYRAALGTEFGTVISGFFLDAPALWNEAQCASRQCLPWSPALPKIFHRQHGYDLISHLPALIAPAGDDAARVRQDFWQTVARLMRENLYQPFCDWARAHGLEYTGHLTPEGQQPLNVSHTADNAPFYRMFQPPGVVVALDAEARRRDDPSARLCASMVALQGQSRVLEEISQDGWDTVLSERVSCLSYQWQHGVNGVTVHSGANAELSQPYWARWRAFADYVARCSYALAQSRPAARIGLLLATRSEWAHYHPKGHRLTRWVREDLDHTVRLLNELHYDFILLPEDDLSKADCSESRLWCGPARLPLEMIIVPGATTLSWAAWRKIEAFVADGGKVACLGLLPRWSERGRDSEFEEHVGKATLQTVDDLYEAYAAYE